MNEQTLDKDIQVKATSKQRSKVVNTALKMVSGFQNIKNDKENRVNTAQELYLKAVDGLLPTRKERIPSFLLNQLTEIFVTYIRVPDVQVKSYGTDIDVLVIMSAYLEKIVKEGGFNDLMTYGWSGYHQLALFGDFFVQCGYKTEGKIGMPEYRGLSVGNFYTNKSASKIRGRTAGQSAGRIGLIFQYDRNEIESIDFFEGVTKVAKTGDIPLTSVWENYTDEKTDIQKSEECDYYQVLFFYDEHKDVYSVIVGSNAFEWATFKGDEGQKAYPFIFQFNGETKSQLPVAHFGLFANPKGIFHTGLGELFIKVASSMGDLQSGVVNNAIDNKNAPAVLNLPSVDTTDLFGQLKLAKEQKEKYGDNTFVVPTYLDNTVQPIGRGNIDYLKNETGIEEFQAIKQRFDEEVRRFGFNLDSFFNQQDTARQSELDIIGQNQTISKFQAQNTESYRFIYEFAVHCIKEFGDENDETPFGSDIKLSNGLNAEEMNITVGKIVQAFKEKDIQIEIDTKNGFVTNPLLELRSIQRLLQVAPAGSSAQSKLFEALARAEGQTISKEEVVPAIPMQGQSQGQIPQINTQAIEQQLSQ